MNYFSTHQWNIWIIGSTIGNGSTSVLNASQNIGSTSSASSKKEESEEFLSKQSEEEVVAVEEDEEEYLEEDVIDLRSFGPIGPLVVVDLIQLPHQAKEIKGWVVQQGLLLLLLL